MLTLNLLRNARTNPNLSAWEYIFGCYYFKATPLAPPGIKLVIHEKPTQRGSWDPPGVVGFYIGPAMKHYRCIKCYVPSTKGERVTDTATFMPHNTPIPQLSPTELIQQSLQKIIKITNSPPNHLSFIPENEDTHEAIKQLAKIFNNKTLQRTVAPSIAQKSMTFYKDNIPNKYNLPVPTNLPTTASSLVEMPAPFPRVKDNNHTSYKRAIHKALSTVQHIYPRNNSPSTQCTSKPTHKTIKAIFPTVHHIYNEHGKKETIDTLRNSAQKDVWEWALSNEWGRLAQGNIYGVQATDTIEFITPEEIPKGKDITYASFVCDHRPLKTEPWRVRIVIGGDKLSYANDTGSPAASLLETNIFINSTYLTQQ